MLGRRRALRGPRREALRQCQKQTFDSNLGAWEDLILGWTEAPEGSFAQMDTGAAYKEHPSVLSHACTGCCGAARCCGEIRKLLVRNGTESSTGTEDPACSKSPVRRRQAGRPATPGFSSMKLVHGLSAAADQTAGLAACNAVNVTRQGSPSGFAGTLWAVSDGPLRADGALPAR